MSGISTALRAFLTRRLDPATVFWYAVLIGALVVITIAGTALIASYGNL